MTRPDPDALERQLAAARGEAGFHRDRNVLLERRQAALEARVAQFVVHDGHLAYVPHDPADGGPCTTPIACPQALLALEGLFGTGTQLATRPGSETALDPYHPTVAPVAAGGSRAPTPTNPTGGRDRDRLQDEALGRVLPELHPRWASHTQRLSALGRIDPCRWPAVEADLELVDRLQVRLGQMTFPHPHGGEPMAADVPLEQLLRAARNTIVHWHENDQRTGSGTTT